MNMASNRFSIGTGGNWVVTGGFVLNTERTFSSTYGVDIVNYNTQSRAAYSRVYNKR